MTIEEKAMETLYKHKETGELYRQDGYSHRNKVIELKFSPLNKNLERITIETKEIIDADAIYNKKGICPEFREAQNKNDENALNNALNTFEQIELDVKIELKDTIISGVFEIKYICPLCGSILKQHGGAYLTSPPQYDNNCIKDGCGFSTCTSRWHSGSLVCGTDKDEVYRIVTSGTFEEKEELEEYSKKMLKYV